MNKNKFNSSRQGPAINDRINAKSVRVLRKRRAYWSPRNKKAIKMAFDQGLDLVQVSLKRISTSL